MTTGMRAQAVGHPLATSIVRVLETYEGMEEVFEPEAFFDINIPTWRFQVQGADRFVDWLKSFSPDGYRIRPVRVLATGEGFLLEVEGEYAAHGQTLFFRNLYVCAVSAGRINEVSFWCTGDWDPEIRARHSAEITLIRA